MNIIARLDFELEYLKAAVQYFNHYACGSPLQIYLTHSWELNLYVTTYTQSVLLFTHSWRENNWIIPFPRVLVLCEIQSFSSRIWTRVAVSISYNDNHYTTNNNDNDNNDNKIPVENHQLTLVWKFLDDQDINNKAYRGNNEKLKSVIDFKKKRFSLGEKPVRFIPGRCAINITFFY